MIVADFLYIIESLILQKKICSCFAVPMICALYLQIIHKKIKATHLNISEKPSEAWFKKKDGGS